MALAALTGIALLACTSKPKPDAAGADRAATRTGADADPDADADADGEGEPTDTVQAKEDLGPPAEPGTKESPTAAAPIGGARIWVTGDDALLGLDLDGKLEQSIPVPDGVGAVRRRSAGDFVGLALGDPGEVVVFDEGKTKRFAIPTVIPEQGCTPRLSKSEEDYGAADARLELQDAWDFGLSDGQQRACILLLDRNVNMASYGVDIQVDLKAGKAKASVYADESGECSSDDPPSCDDRDPLSPWIELEAEGPWADWSEHSVSEEVKDGAWRFSYDSRTGKVSDKKGEKEIMLCRAEGDRDVSPEFDCAQIEEVSTSYRWLLVHGPIEEGDYIHRDLFIFDRKAGELLTVEPGVEKTARKLNVIDPSKAFAGGIEAFDAVGESDIASLPSDRLWLDGLLVIPERREAVAVHGTRVLTARD